jgi:peptide-methionine (R)-S-oxide reductase
MNDFKKKLTAEQFRVTQKHGTEPPFSGVYNNKKDKGEYLCVCCKAKLFSSTAKYDSGSGWPAFYEPISENALGSSSDNSLFMERTEVHCSKCEAHLGHVFKDGPQPTGLRYCINSVSLDFKNE